MLDFLDVDVNSYRIMSDSHVSDCRREPTPCHGQVTRPIRPTTSRDERLGGNRLRAQELLPMQQRTTRSHGLRLPVPSWPLTALLAVLLVLTTPQLLAAQEPRQLEGDFAVTISRLDVPRDLANGPTLIGRWRITFNTDGTYALERHDVGTLVTGTFTVDGNQVTITDESGLLACAAGPGGFGDVSSGTYRWEFARDRLTLTPVEDSCLGRRILLATRELTVFVACLTEPLTPGVPLPRPTPEAGDESPLDILRPGTTPAAEPPSSEQEIAQAIDDLLAQMTACWATGDPARFLPLLSAEFRASLLASGDNFTQSLAAAMAAPITWERAGDIDIIDATHVSAIVRTSLGVEEDFVRFNFVFEDGAWRWDG